MLHMYKKQLPIIIGGLSFLIQSSAFAAAFEIKETSASLLGSAFAGATTSTGDISSMHFNPATLSLIDNGEALLGLSYIIPSLKAENATCTGGGCMPLKEGNFNNIGNNELVPYGYLGYRVNDKIALGLAVTAPWGLSTEYPDDWAGANYAMFSKIQGANINPIVSFQINEKISIAGGPQIQWTKAEISSAIPNIALNELYVSGNTFGYGWNIGVLLSPTEDLKFGLSYRSKIKVDIDNGSWSSDLLNSGGSASTTINLPEQVNAGVQYAINPQWSIMGDVQWTRWDRIPNLTVYLDDFGTPGNTNESVTPLDWKNAWFYTIGSTYAMNEKLTLRSGLAFDQTPTPGPETRTPRLPDSDRYWISFGVGYNISNNIDLDLGYTLLIFKNASSDLDESDLPEFTADYKGYANLLSAGLTWKF